MGLVLDASVLAEIVLRTERGAAAQAQTLPHAPDLNVPDLAVPEALSALRNAEFRGRFSSDAARQAADALLRFPARLWPSGLVARRAWRLRHAVSLYDASYVALAEALDVPLLTGDSRLARGAAAHTGATIITV
jgi:predicted nucleic acid-binding protein